MQKEKQYKEKQHIASTNPIGVFDSGMGGLTVLRSLRQALPNESFIYLGDTARLPYGTKSVATVREYALQMAKVLIERQVKALVIACNTATTAALSHLQEVFVNIPILGVIAPGAKAAVEATKNQKIAVLATETTILSYAYQNQIALHLPEAKINGRACSVLVALAEEGMVNNNVAIAALEYYLDTFEDEDTILLGCTHFPVFKPILREIVSSKIKIVDSADTTAKALVKLLDENQLLNIKVSGSVGSSGSVGGSDNGNGNGSVGSNLGGQSKGEVQYLVTDSIKRFQSVGEVFLNEGLKRGDIELIDAGHIHIN